ncbi:MAG: nuclear transport factor 2 family protein [Candidatus Heimdallarchaeota archaeon]|nr:nuclear transport factor 2 family protein [Candidatus Heimdallarchaeota archaeon]
MNAKEELEPVLRELLHAIRSGDAEKYTQMSSPELTCFEPETQGSRVDGLDFHLFFMNNQNPSNFYFEIVNPVYRIEGNLGYAVYTLIDNRVSDTGFDLKQVNETRIFEKLNGKWIMIHFHRSHTN